MKSLIFCLALGFLVSASLGAKLVWEDRFDGDHIDTSKWSFEIGNVGGNQEQVYYTNRTSNCFVKGGKLYLQALKESFGGQPYTSCRMVTRDKHEWKFGRFEASIKLPKGRGLWPAFWMMPHTIKWPIDGEIDIMENLGHDMVTAYSTIHYGTSWRDHKSKGASYKLPSGGFDDGFHLFRVDWYDGYMVFFIDNKQIFVISKTQIEKNQWWPFSANKFFVILNLAVGGNWPGPPNGDTKFPAQMIVEYVRVYTL